MERTRVAIVGAGPIGIELAVALKREGVDYVHLDAGQVGSTIQWYAPGTKFFSSPERIAIAGVPLVTPGQDKAIREQYLAYLRAVVDQFDLAIRTYTRVESIRRAEDGFVLESVPSSHGVGGPGDMDRSPCESNTSPSLLHARRVVLAIGDMHRAQLLGIPGEDLPHVSHFFDDPHVYFRRRVLIVGGKNSAAEAALRCHRVGADVTISYRGQRFDPKRVKYWVRPELEWLIDKGRISFLPGTQPVRITPDAVRLERIAGSGESTGGPIEVATDFVLLLTGYEQDASLFESLGVDLVGPQRRPRLNHATMETNVPGLYVAGTAVGGTQAGGVKIFIENSHVHVDRIVASILGRKPPPQRDQAEESLPES